MLARTLLPQQKSLPCNQRSSRRGTARILAARASKSREADCSRPSLKGYWKEDDGLSSYVATLQPELQQMLEFHEEVGAVRGRYPVPVYSLQDSLFCSCCSSCHPICGVCTPHSKFLSYIAHGCFISGNNPVP